MFVCMSCGSQTPAPTVECPRRVLVYSDNTEYYMPCSTWPMTPEEYLKLMAAEEGMDAFFTGTVILPDGGRIEVSAPIPLETAKEIGCIATQVDLMGERWKLLERKRQLLQRKPADFDSLGVEYSESIQRPKR